MCRGCSAHAHVLCAMAASSCACARSISTQRHMVASPGHPEQLCADSRWRATEHAAQAPCGPPSEANEGCGHRALPMPQEPGRREAQRDHHGDAQAVHAANGMRRATTRRLRADASAISTSNPARSRRQRPLRLLNPVPARARVVVEVQSDDELTTPDNPRRNSRERGYKSVAERVPEQSNTHAKHS